MQTIEFGKTPDGGEDVALSLRLAPEPGRFASTHLEIST